MEQCHPLSHVSRIILRLIMTHLPMNLISISSLDIWCRCNSEITGIQISINNIKGWGDMEPLLCNFLVQQLDTSGCVASRKTR